MKKSLFILLLLLPLLAALGTVDEVREGRPFGKGFGPENYHHIAYSEEGPKRVEDLSPAELVNSLMGTDSTFAFSHGNLYPAVGVPWGMNLWSPQTGANANGWMYTYRAARIRGFRQAHQPSPWAGDYGSFSLMPMTGAPILNEVTRASNFHHKNEIAKPYYYKVRLDRYGVDVEITATERAAVMRLIYPKNFPAFMVLDLLAPGGKAEVEKEERRITGYTAHKTGGAPANFRNYFVIESDAKIAASGEMGTTHWIKFETGNRAPKGAPTAEGNIVTLRIASSYIDLDQAKVNLSREIGARGFDEVKAEAKETWNRELRRIEIKGGTIEQRVTFYTALHRMILFPHRFHEIGPNGEVRHYSPYDGEVHEGVLYTDTGLWDTFRALFPFLTLMYPERDAEIMNGFLNAYKEGGRLPSWSSPGYYDSMIGAHGASVLADAYVKGIRGFDAELAWEAMVKDAEVSEPRMKSMGRAGVEYYNALGYVPCDVGINESAARTLEYAYDDFCMAMFARAAGRPRADVDKYLARAMNYKNLFNPATGFMQGKKENGEWHEPFNPFAWGGDFTEGSSWHYTWSVFQDVAGLIDLMGGREKFIAKLDSVFITPPEADWSAYGYRIHEITEMQAGGMGQYAHGNQPIQHAIYLYNWAGAPWKCQARVREVMDKLYTPYPNGYCGDEDNGQTSAWYVFSALGFYPVCPGTGQYVLGSPLFEKAVMHLPNGNIFTIAALDNNKDEVFISRSSLNGFEFNRTYLTHGEILSGGALELQMSDRPNLTRGSDPSDAPFSLSQ